MMKAILESYWPRARSYSDDYMRGMLAASRALSGRPRYWLLVVQECRFHPKAMPLTNLSMIALLTLHRH